MTKYLFKSLIILLVFILPFIASGLSSLITKHILVDTFGLTDGSRLIFDFLLMFFVVLLSLKLFDKHIGINAVLITVGISLIVLFILNASGKTIKFSVKIAPLYISRILGLVAAFHYFIRKQNKLKIPLLLFIFPLILSMGINDLWVHKIEYGNWTGEVQAQQVANFELQNKEGAVVNNQTLKGKIVLFDFWYINCGPCWKNFPKLQQIYNKYEANPLVEVYAVNRPMRYDKPSALFSKIEDKGYTFPVLKGSQNVMDILGVYKYPTVMILNQNGDMVFMGELRNAEKKLESLLASIQ